MPPRKKTENTLSSLLEETPAPEQEPAKAEETAPVLTAEQAEIEALRAELAAEREKKAQAANHPTDDNGRPLPDSALTAEQLEIRNLQDQLARQKGRNDAVEEVFEDTSEGVLVHFLRDGISANGRTYYQGQEVLFGPGAYEETKDRFGVSWIEMTDEQQMTRWKEIKFRKGPWPGKRQYEDEAAKNIPIATQAPVTRI